MSVSSLLTLTDFWNKIRFAGRPEIELQHYKQLSTDGAGNDLPAKFGQPKWAADVVTAGGWHDADMQTQAMLKLLLGREGRFLAYDIRRPYPKLDPGGAAVDGHNIKVRTIGTDNRSLSLKNLPTWYELSVSDRLSITDGAGRRALFELMEDKQSGGDGNTGEFEVQPFLPAWISADMAVDLVKPVAKFRILPGSYKPQTGSGNRTSGIFFSMISVST